MSPTRPRRSRATPIAALVARLNQLSAGDIEPQRPDFWIDRQLDPTPEHPWGVAVQGEVLLDLVPYATELHGSEPFRFRDGSTGWSTEIVVDGVLVWAVCDQPVVLPSARGEA